MKKQKIKKLRKGENGYINSRKKDQLLMAVLYGLIGVFIFVLGLVLNKFEKNNIFTLFAIMMVLPAAKRLVNFIVFAPYKSVDKALCEKVRNKLIPGDIMYTDAVFTSPEHVMFLSFIIIAGNEIIGLSFNESQHKKDAKKLDDAMLEYLKERMKKMGYNYKVTIAKSVDAFLSAYSSVNRSIERSEEEKEQVNSFIYSLIVE